MSVITWDLEAESLNLRSARPWQIAMSSPNNTLYENIDIPNLSVSKGAAQATRFSIEHHDKVKIPLQPLAKKLKKVFESNDHTFVGHNILGYDIYVLRNLFEEAGYEFDMQSFATKCHDTLAFSRAMHFDVKPPEDRGMEFLAWQYKMLSKFERGMKTSLGHMAKSFDIEVDENKTHDALYDVEINTKVYHKLIYALDI